MARSEKRDAVEVKVGSGYATVAEVASYLRTCRATVYNVMDRGELRFAKIGTARRVLWADVLAFCERNTVAAR